MVAVRQPAQRPTMYGEAFHAFHGIERHGLWGAPTNKNPPTACEIYARHHELKPGKVRPSSRLRGHQHLDQ